jgi:hypothetical protein
MHVASNANGTPRHVSLPGRRARGTRLDMAGIRTGPAGVPARRRPVRRRPAPRDRHRRRRRRARPRPACRNGHLRRIDPGQRPLADDRHRRRVLRHPRPPGLDHGQARQPGRRGRRRRHDRPERRRGARGSVCPPRHPDDQRPERLPRPAAVPAAPLRLHDGRHLHRVLDADVGARPGGLLAAGACGAGCGLRRPVARRVGPRCGSRRRNPRRPGRDGRGRSGRQPRSRRADGASNLCAGAIAAEDVRGDGRRSPPASPKRCCAARTAAVRHDDATGSGVRGPHGLAGDRRARTHAVCAAVPPAGHGGEAPREGSVGRLGAAARAGHPPGGGTPDGCPDTGPSRSPGCPLAAGDPAGRCPPCRGSAPPSPPQAARVSRPGNEPPPAYD